MQVAHELRRVLQFTEGIPACIAHANEYLVALQHVYSTMISRQYVVALYATYWYVSGSDGFYS